MKKPEDLLLVGILATTGLVFSLATLGGASFHAGISRSVFSISVFSHEGVEPALSTEVLPVLSPFRRLLVGSYRVQSRDTLESVARLVGSRADYLRSSNRLNSTVLTPGRVLAVHSGQGMVYKVRQRQGVTETLSTIAKRYNRSAADLARVNRLPGVALLSNDYLTPGQPLLLPGVSLRFTDYLSPVLWVPGRRLISSGFGMRRHPVTRVRRFHSGVDIPRAEGSSVRATREGTVVFAGWKGGYGWLIVLRHSDGYTTYYGHLSKIGASVGQRVRKGQHIGNVGHTGVTTGPHLHFEVRDAQGRCKNPKRFIF